MVHKELLVVDDEPVLAKALSALFTERGFTVNTAGTARDALTQMDKVQADIVLLDLKLPDSSGLDVLTELKTKFPHLRVVVISAFTDEATIQEARQRGASGYLAKPFDFERCFYTAMGIEAVDVTDVQADAAALARLPAAVAKRVHALPIRWVGDALLVAMAHPLDEAHLADVKATLDCPIHPAAVLRGDLDAAIRRCYQSGGDVAKRTYSAPAIEAPQPLAPDVPAADPGLTQLLDGVIARAHAQGVTDLHFGIGPQGPWMRQRVDGVVSDVSIPGQIAAFYLQVVSHVKALAHLECCEHRSPQQGRVAWSLNGAMLDLRVSILPTQQGEHLAIRITEPSKILSLDQLGLEEEQRSQLEGLLKKSSGLLLVTGPSGAGKSGTLYACLSRLNTGRANIVTIEDPVDHEIAGITQIPVQPHTGLTFADGLRAALQHDPDVVMVGELPDAEAASLAVRTALTGRFVLSTLHTNDASSVVTRLLDLGIEPFFLCSTVSGILAQRLIRRLCMACREPLPIEAANLAPLGLTVPKLSGKMRLWRAKGCDQCRHTGYQGRTAIFELIVVDHQIRSLMIKRTSGLQIRQSAVSRGMITLSQAIWQKAQVGETSLEELVRVLPAELRS